MLHSASPSLLGIRRDNDLCKTRAAPREEKLDSYAMESGMYVDLKEMGTVIFGEVAAEMRKTRSPCRDYRRPYRFMQ